MMSLVAYGSSDESESEEVSDAAPSVSNSAPSTAVPSCPPSTVNGVDPNQQLNKSSLHSKLPPPKATSDRQEVEDEVPCSSSTLSLASKLPTPKQHSSSSLNFSIRDTKTGFGKGPVKILIPALSDFPDEEDQPKPKKKIQPSSKGSGLFALLPPPQQLSLKETNRSLIPNTVSRKPKPSHPIKRPTPKVIQKIPIKQKKESDSESDGEHADADFFSLNKEDELPALPLIEPPVTADVGIFDSSSQSQSVTYQPQTQILAHNYEQYEDNNYVPETNPDSHSDSGQDFIPVTTENLELDDEAIRQLCGRQGKRRREEVQIVDVSGDAIMPDQREWLTKQLTEEKPRSSSSKSKLFGPSSQQRRKHQITYLAHVAKENELELKNSWANNRQTRKQTQSKYGF